MSVIECPCAGTEWIALAGVASTAVVALGSMAVTRGGQVEQRRHDSDLAYESRVWEAKSTALYEVISSVRSLVIALEDGSAAGPVHVVGQVPRTIEVLTAQTGAVESYTSESCRDAFTRVRKMLEGDRPDVLTEIFIEESRRKKEEAIDAQDFDAAARERDNELRHITEAFESMPWKGPKMTRACEDLIEQARTSMRTSSPELAKVERRGPYGMLPGRWKR